MKNCCKVFVSECLNIQLGVRYSQQPVQKEHGSNMPKKKKGARGRLACLRRSLRTSLQVPATQATAISNRQRPIINTLRSGPISAITRATEEVFFQPTVCKFCRGSTASCMSLFSGGLFQQNVPQGLTLLSVRRQT